MDAGHGTLPVPLPARHNRRIPLPPMIGKRPPRSSGGLHRRRCVDRPEIRSHPFAVFPDDKPQAVADLMHDTQLNLGVRVSQWIDTQINGGLQRGAAFFASTSIIAIGGCFALLPGSTDIVLQVFQDIPIKNNVRSRGTSIQLAVFALNLLRGVTVARIAGVTNWHGAGNRGGWSTPRPAWPPPRAFVTRSSGHVDPGLIRGRL